MTENKIAERYARALLNLSQEQGAVDLVHNDLLGIAKVIDESAELKAFLRHPTLTRQQQDDGIDALFASRVDTRTHSFIKFLAERRRLAYLSDICRSFEDLHREAHNVLRVAVNSAESLTDAQADTIRNKMAEKYGKSIELSTHVDAHLIGGFTIQVLDSVQDSSVKGKIDALRRTMCHA